MQSLRDDLYEYKLLNSYSLYFYLLDITFSDNSEALKIGVSRNPYKRIMSIVSQWNRQNQASGLLIYRAELLTEYRTDADKDALAVEQDCIKIIKLNNTSVLGTKEYTRQIPAVVEDICSCIQAACRTGLLYITEVPSCIDCDSDWWNDWLYHRDCPLPSVYEHPAYNAD